MEHKNNVLVFQMFVFTLFYIAYVFLISYVFGLIYSNFWYGLLTFIAAETLIVGIICLRFFIRSVKDTTRKRAEFKDKISTIIRMKGDSEAKNESGKLAEVLLYERDGPDMQ